MRKKCGVMALCVLFWALTAVGSAALADTVMSQWLQLQDSDIGEMLYRGETPTGWDAMFVQSEYSFSELELDGEQLTGFLVIHATETDEIVVRNIAYPGREASFTRREAEDDSSLFCLRYSRYGNYIGVEKNGATASAPTETSLWGKMRFVHPEDELLTSEPWSVDFRIDPEKRDHFIETFLQEDSPYFDEFAMLSHELHPVFSPDAQQAIKESLPIAPLTAEDAEQLISLLRQEELLQEIFEEKVPMQMADFAITNTYGWEDETFLWKRVELTHQAKGIALEYEFNRPANAEEEAYTTLTVRRFSPDGAQRNFEMKHMASFFHREGGGSLTIWETKDFDGVQEVDDYVLAEYFLCGTLEAVTSEALKALLTGPDGLVQDGKISPLYAELRHWYPIKNE